MLCHGRDVCLTRPLLEQATLSTTDSEWAPIQKVAADAVDDGSVLHKEVSFFGLDVQLQRAQEAEVDSWERSWLGEGGDEADGRASGVKEGGEGRVAVEIPTAVAGRVAVGMAIGDRARAPLLSPPPPVQQLVAVSGLRGRMRIKKRLKRDLTGSVASDWWGDEYLFLLSAASDGVPRLQLTGVLLRLKWSEELVCTPPALSGGLRGASSELSCRRSRSMCSTTRRRRSSRSATPSTRRCWQSLARVVAALGASLLFTRLGVNRRSSTLGRDRSCRHMRRSRRRQRRGSPSSSGGARRSTRSSCM